MTDERRAGGYVPALGFRSLTRFYDTVLAWTLREEHFKGLLVDQAAIEPGHRVLDLGCGTATLTMMIKRRHPGATVVGLDGDPDVLDIAHEKISDSGLDIRLHRGLGSNAPFEDGSFDRIVSSLVFHHLVTDEKLRTFARTRALLSPGGELHVADWGRAQNLLMRAAFLPVQLLDGFGPTSDNVQGRLPALMAEAGFDEPVETHRLATLLGTLSLYRARMA